MPRGEFFFFIEKNFMWILKNKLSDAWDPLFPQLSGNSLWLLEDNIRVTNFKWEISYRY